MIIVGLDLETTGLSAETDQITEVGAVLWDTEMNAPVKFFSKLLKIKGEVPELIVKLTGITDELLSKYGENPETVWDEFAKFADIADGYMAHNAPFDRGFLEKQLPGIEKELWIDTSVDLDFDESIQTRKLTYLAAEHGLINPFAHRAMTDTLLMCQLASGYDWNATIQNARTPSVTLKAMVTYEQNQKAKGNGYRWDGTNKNWVKQVKEHKVAAEVSKCKDLGFLTKRIG